MYVGRFDDAETSITRSIALDTNFADGYSALAYLYCIVGDYDKCLAMASKTSELDPYAARPATYRGIAYFGQEDYTAAIAELTRGLTLNPDFGYLHQWLAAAYIHLGQETQCPRLRCGGEKAEL